MADDGFADALVAQLPGLRRYALALAGNAALADDLVQDCIERALRQSAQLRDMASLPGWLRRILRNLYIDDIRRGRGRGQQQDIMDFADHPALSVAAEDGGTARDFLRAMNALSLEHREILLLVGLEDLAYRDIAEELGIPIGTVMSRLARARARLRALLQDEPASDVIPFPPKDKP
jgi:RNA polymerase sigma-70 factor (ECF subfamily)